MLRRLTLFLRDNQSVLRNLHRCHEPLGLLHEPIRLFNECRRAGLQCFGCRRQLFIIRQFGERLFDFQDGIPHRLGRFLPIRRLLLSLLVRGNHFIRHGLSRRHYAIGLRQLFLGRQRLFFGNVQRFQNFDLPPSSRVRGDRL